MSNYIGIDFIGTNVGSGSKTYNINFCNELNSLQLKNKIKIFICKNYYSQINKEIKKNKNIKFILKPNFLSISFIRILWIQFILPFELKYFGIKKLYSPLNFCPILAKFFSIKVVLCCHSNLPWVYFNLMPGNLIRNFFVKKLMEYSIFSCNVLIVNSFYAKREIIKILKIKEKKIKVVYLGIGEALRLANARLSLIGNFRSNKRYILSVISCVRYHNIINILIAFKKLIYEINYSVSLVLVMQILDKKYFKELKNYIQNNFEDNKIIILTNLNKREVAKLYKNAEVYVFTSYCEVFGLTPLEAMSYKVPVAVSNKSALPEINKKAALYFDPDNINQIKNVLKKTLLNKNLRNKLIKRGTKNLERFILSKNIKNTYKILKELNDN
jgi:glycosyltransferase involved in cell wall biosynthesis